MDIKETVNLVASLLGIIAIAIPVYVWVTK